MSGTWTSMLLAVGITVVVGLGLAVADRAGHGPGSPALGVLRRLHLPAAAAAVASLAVAEGWRAGVLAAIWGLFTAAVGVIGVGRVLSRRALDAGTACDAGLVLLGVGGIWLVVSRAGLTPLGFDPAIVELTAVHLHHAGFALPIAAGAAATRAERGPLVPLTATAAVPLTAVGIAVGGAVETVAATVMALAGLAVAVLLVRVGRDSLGAPRLLLVAAGISLGLGMALALLWAWSVLLGDPVLTLPAMARTHGSLNGFGLGMAGLGGLALLGPRPPAQPSQVVVHLGRRGARLARIHEAALDAPPASDPTLLTAPDAPGHERFRVERELGAGDLDSARRAFEEWVPQRSAGIALHPPVPDLVEGSTLALLGPLGPLSFSATCRVTRVIDEPDRVGFVYTTLPHHPEEGSESFVVHRAPDGRLVGTIEAVWRPASLATAWCRPITRRAQRHYVERYLDGLQAAISRTPSPRSSP